MPLPEANAPTKIDIFHPYKRETLGKKEIKKANREFREHMYGENPNQKINKLSKKPDGKQQSILIKKDVTSGSGKNDPDNDFEVRWVYTGTMKEAAAQQASNLYILTQKM